MAQSWDLYPYPGGDGALDTESRGRKHKLDTVDDNSPKRIKREDETEKEMLGTATLSLPLEILTMILSEALVSTPECALNLLVPEWNTCRQYDPVFDNPLYITGVVTYTRGIAGGAGSLLASHGHEHADHLVLLVKSFHSHLLTLNKWCHDEAIRAYFLEGAQIFELTDDTTLENIDDESFLENWRYYFPIRGRRSREILPYDDEQPGAEKKTLPSGSPYVYQLLRHIIMRSPLTLMNVNANSMAGYGADIYNANLEALDRSIDLDRSSPIWLSWSKMPMLESVLLDLRIYSQDVNTERGFLSKDEVISRAREMGRWLRLKLLVIAGLQSYSFIANYDSYKAESIEEVDEMDGEPNWIKIFSPAVRPGGTLILVDRLTDNVMDAYLHFPERQW
ncbi:hypothetical protein F5Y11DRAFT_319883 [Daldinia sp. FL1419]|nr:hypothetical protein F5Y11DRAFT_319883 [Daldinia sp. FL1419]